MFVRIPLLMLLSSSLVLAQAPVPPGTPTPTPPPPVEPKPMETKPVDPKPMEPKPVDPKPMDAKPVDPKPMTPVPTPPAATPPAAPLWPATIGGKDLAAWIKEFAESKDGSIREQAVKVIPQFGPAARGPTLKPLLKRLGEETDPGVRVNIILVLGIIGAEKPDEATRICDALNGIILRAGPGSPVRLHATRALSSFGNAGAMALPTLENIAEDPAWETRQTVVMALGRIGRPKDLKLGASVAALNSLTKRLPKEESAVVRLEIAQSLLLLGPPAFKPEIPGDYPRVIKPYLDIVLKKLETETDDATRVWLTMVMMQYDGNTLNDTNIAKIADNLHKPDLYVKYAALRSLALLGERAKPALGAMVTQLKNDDLNVVAEAISALAAMKAAAKDAVPELEKLKQNPNDSIKQMAIQAIEMINKAPVPPPVVVPPAPPKK